MERLYRRRSKRLALRVRILVYGHARTGGAFREETHTLNVNANGTLITLSAPVELSQTLVLVNGMTGEEQECRVAYVGPRSEERASIGLAFRHPSPHFWQVDFPLTPSPQQDVPDRRAVAHAGARR